MSSRRRSEITGAVLAGGLGTRMGGADKGLIGYRGRPLVSWALAALRPQVGHLLVVANRNGAEYARYCPHVYADRLPGHPGPLAGLHTALSEASTDLVLCVPCDVPRLPADLAQRLHEALLASGADGCCVHDGKRAQPLICLLHRRLAGSLEQALSQGMRKVMAWQAGHEFVAVDFSDARACFDNLNSPEQLTGEPTRPEHVSAHAAAAAAGDPRRATREDPGADQR